VRRRAHPTLDTELTGPPCRIPHLGGNRGWSSNVRVWRRADSPPHLRLRSFLLRSDTPLRVSRDRHPLRLMQPQRVRVAANCGRWGDRRAQNNWESAPGRCLLMHLAILAKRHRTFTPCAPKCLRNCVWAMKLRQIRTFIPCLGESLRGRIANGFSSPKTVHPYAANKISVLSRRFQRFRCVLHSLATRFQSEKRRSILMVLMILMKLVAIWIRSQVERHYYGSRSC
jgi:hypothetical protein